MIKLAQAKQIADKYRNDPHVWGRTKQVVGGLLVADGLVGLENPLDGKKSRPGILGTLFFVAFGLLFGGVGLFGIFGGIDTDTETTGTVTDVTRNRSGSSGSTTCGLLATYIVDGRTYTAGTHGSTNGNCGKYVGSEVTVGYQSAHPEVGQIKTTELFMWLFPVIGGIVLLFGIGVFVARLASIIGGAYLFITGRKQASDNPASNGNAEEAVVAVRQEVLDLLLAGRRRLHVNDSLAGQAPTGTSEQPSTAPPATLGGLFGALAVQVRDAHAAAHAAATQQASNMAPSPVAPTNHPTGWYPTADGTHERFWDGFNWSTEARPTQPPVPPQQPETHPSSTCR